MEEEERDVLGMMIAPDEKELLEMMNRLHEEELRENLDVTEGMPRFIPRLDFPITITKKLISRNRGNFIFSPEGLCSILEILQRGTDNSNLYGKINELLPRFSMGIKSDDDANFHLAHAVSVWYDEKLGAVKEDFLESIESMYEAEAISTDFAQAKETKLRVDRWVSAKTHDLIKSLKTEIGQSTLMLLLEALYMKAKWNEPFDPSLTETVIFHNEDGTESEVDMMYHDFDAVEYYETEAYQVIHLPYASFKYYMEIVLPREGYDIDEIMTEEEWLKKATEEQKVEFFMPRFKFDSMLSFKEILTELGLGDLFEKEDSLPYITELPAHVSDIKQQCAITVEEEGTEAAAVTMVEFDLGGLPSEDEIPKKITMRVDRPFGFVIREVGYEKLLFMGVVKDMSKE